MINERLTIHERISTDEECVEYFERHLLMHFRESSGIEKDMVHFLNEIVNKFREDAP